MELEEIIKSEEGAEYEEDIDSVDGADSEGDTQPGQTRPSSPMPKYLFPPSVSRRFLPSEAHLLPPAYSSSQSGTRSPSIADSLEPHHERLAGDRAQCERNGKLAEDKARRERRKAIIQRYVFDGVITVDKFEPEDQE